MLAVSVWAADPERAAALAEAVRGPGRVVHLLADDAALANAWRATPSGVLIAEDGPRTEMQLAFLHLPLILVRAGGRPASRVAQRAYATVGSAAEAALALDRLAEHQQLAALAARRREPPRGCSRCGRGYDVLKVRGAGLARRFVKFGTIALCGSCLDQLRRLLRAADAPFVEADARR